MDARSIAVERHILQYLRKHKVYVRKGMTIVAQDVDGKAVDISLRDFATYVADKMKPE